MTIARRVSNVTKNGSFLRTSSKEIWMDVNEGHENLRDLLLVPNDSVGVITTVWLEPQVETLLPTSDTVGKDIGLHDVGLSRHVAQKFVVELVVISSLRGQLQFTGTQTSDNTSRPQSK